MTADIFSTLDDLAKAVTTLRRQLEPIKRLVPSAGRRAGRPKVRRHATRKVRPIKARRVAKRAVHVSAKVRALRKLQGRYMGLVRRLTAAQKAQVKKVKQGKGYPAAFAMAKKLGA